MSRNRHHVSAPRFLMVGVFWEWEWAWSPQNSQTAAGQLPEVECAADSAPLQAMRPRVQPRHLIGTRSVSSSHRKTAYRVLHVKTSRQLNNKPFSSFLPSLSFPFPFLLFSFLFFLPLLCLIEQSHSLFLSKIEPFTKRAAVSFSFCVEINQVE